MIFGKHINRYYLKYAGWLFFGLLALVTVDFLQLEIPKLYGMVINGINTGYVEQGNTVVPFDMNFVLDSICMPMVMIILIIIVGRFLWRVCFFGSAVRLEEDLRNKMARCKAKESHKGCKNISSHNLSSYFFFASKR